MVSTGGATRRGGFARLPEWCWLFTALLSSACRCHCIASNCARQPHEESAAANQHLIHPCPSTCRTQFLRGLQEERAQGGTRRRLPGRRSCASGNQGCTGALEQGRWLWRGQSKRQQLSAAGMQTWCSMAVEGVCKAITIWHLTRATAAIATSCHRTCTRTPTFPRSCAAPTNKH